MYIDGLKIEESETAFEVLRINYEMCSRAFYSLAKGHNSPESLIDMGIELHNKAGTCTKCRYGKVCEAYQMQFKCYPFDVKMRYKASPEANSEAKIQFSDFDI